jgi:hypothetical protein
MTHRKKKLLPFPSIFKNFFRFKMSSLQFIIIARNKQTTHAIAHNRFLRREEEEKNVHASGARKARAFGGKKVGKRGKETIVAREKGVARCEESGEDGNVDDEFFARRGVGGERGRGR